MIRRLAVLLIAVGATASISACGGDGGGAPVADERAAQLREVAEEAGLDPSVVDVLVLAARGATATFQVTYGGEDGAEVVVSQAPPDRRVDVLRAGLIVESRVTRDGVGYLCSIPPDGRPGDPLDCGRREGALGGPGTFTADALDRFARELADSVDQVVLTVDERTIAEVGATCLTSAPVPGTPLDGVGATTDTLCLAADGAQLLVDSGGERVVATAYSDQVPEGTFEV